ncbi:2,3-dihydro-2,3-dihydroxybenzoate dehydrogenase [Endozoicomonas sp. SM1973]|uniref:2,3-dihydro-2,3-dihydroxybenzoate dehydrogenase n=1 Tax=Spartinivicinus marinus TaxID=2994442 RepID=A0A853I4K7_9GAMM|nr:2,3-dihydro-2,3-dihydroxybenzoate dehydrogenase [Spartinivicinus marinus]MCX4029500.1 2,3-dihydro-2,3-dihydroxybenzoate dehydrogenase [Spartinivicinus marinus]NYZ65074.1 2,3-dihydro-2,3-dihydroxybenzoate dehydrogenase [Spartinivicinus marinus]
MDFKDKIVLVTGAAQGIGAAVVRKLCQYGATVAALDINETAVKQYADSFNNNCRPVLPFAVDISNSEQVSRSVEQIEKKLGPIEYLVNVAGILRMGSLLSLSDDDWQATFSVNTTGAFNISRTVGCYMKERRSGSIVLVSSNAASVPRMQMGAYAASKAAVTMYAKCLALELAAFNVRCNVVSPGSTDTAMQRALWTADSGVDHVIAGSLEHYRLGIPLQKIATPEMIADAVLFLLSDQASQITMHDLRIDGGATLGC